MISSHQPPPCTLPKYLVPIHIFVMRSFRVQSWLRYTSYFLMFFTAMFFLASAMWVGIHRTLVHVYMLSTIPTSCWYASSHAIAQPYHAATYRWQWIWSYLCCRLNSFHDIVRASQAMYCIRPAVIQGMIRHFQWTDCC